ncbi:hypothetical protein XENTR_v10000402 [Xenopus tropicalis]|nr:hypothetical protein XENTR_v10000402 [Xenopus tropicalis]
MCIKRSYLSVCFQLLFYSLQHFPLLSPHQLAPYLCPPNIHVNPPLCAQPTLSWRRWLSAGEFISSLVLHISRVSARLLLNNIAKYPK